MQTNVIIHADSLEYLKTLPDESIDSVVTDPPYGLAFMGKKWDSFASNKEYAAWCEQWARECLRALKPGGYLLAFSGTRTYHALAWGVESAGFEIRDQISWIYLSGFPKSMDVGKQFDKQAGAEREVVGVNPNAVGRKTNKTGGRLIGGHEQDRSTVDVITAPATPLAQQWDGWGTALKPAHEPIVCARKPLSGTVCANVEQYGTGAVNVDGCRIATDDNMSRPCGKPEAEGWRLHKRTEEWNSSPLGRFPANCITTDTDEWYSPYFNITPQEISKKSSKADRNSDWLGNEIKGEKREVKTFDGGNFVGGGFNNGHKAVNNHPTVKAIPLMAWLVRLVTPPKGIVLDPFAGSGTTLVAAKREGFQYIGIERDEESVQIAMKRVAEPFEVADISAEESFFPVEEKPRQRGLFG